jgi:predicted nucleic acid-binding protein
LKPPAKAWQVSEAIVADANPLLSALLGGRARDILFSRKLIFYSPQHTLFEVEEYLPRVAQKIGQTEAALFREFELLPVTAVQPQQYDSQLERATVLIGQRDPKDVRVLALALQLNVPIWSEDRDFEDLPDVAVHKTTDMLALIGA